MLKRRLVIEELLKLCLCSVVVDVADNQVKRVSLGATLASAMEQITKSPRTV